jgi:hypothetical protein
MLRAPPHPKVKAEEASMGLEGPSIPVRVEPIKLPAPAQTPTPEPEREAPPVETPAEEPVPA